MNTQNTVDYTRKSITESNSINGNESAAKPFLKWAGGKTQLLKQLHRHVPNKFNKYIEPFIGGGAMFFSVNPAQSVIADSNEELIITYRQVKNNIDKVISHLKNFEHNEKFYYEIRKLNPLELDNSYRAARLIYLNKTCFNGLYRVNKKGQFNVPYGKGNGSFLQEETLRNANAFLQNATIITGDYLDVLNQHASEGDFIFLDPPYYPVGKYSDFKRYTKEFFYHDDQVRLSHEFKRLVNIGCKVLLTNSDNEIILDLYSDFKIEIIKTRRMISSNSKTRKGKDIIVIGGHD